VSYLVIALPANPREKLVTRGPFSTHMLAQRKLDRLKAAGEVLFGHVLPVSKGRAAPN
jgi:hypothetical protein